MITVIFLEVVVMVHLLFRNQRPEDTGTNLRISKFGDVVSMFDKGSITLNKGTLEPLQNHSHQDIGNVHNKSGNLPVTTEEFFE